VEERARPLAEPSLSGWANGGSMLDIVLEVVLMEIDPMPLIPEYYFTPVEAIIGITYIYRYVPNIIDK
jgi:hypothetical protein